MRWLTATPRFSKILKGHLAAVAEPCLTKGVTMEKPFHDAPGNTDGDHDHATIVRRHLADIGGGVELSCDDALLF